MTIQTPFEKSPNQIEPKENITNRNIPHIGKSIFKVFSDYRRNPVEFYNSLGHQYDIVAYSILGMRSVFINSPQLIQSLLIEHAKDYDKGALQRYLFRPLVGNGVLNSEGEFHQKQRKLMAPVFTPRHLSNYADIMVEYAEKAQRQWQNGEVINVGQEMMQLTLRVVSKVLMGIEVEAEDERLAEAINVSLQWFKRTSTTITPPLFVPTPFNRRAQRSINYIKQLVKDIISERRKQQNEADSGDLLSMLLQAQGEDGKMSDRQILDEVITFFLAGHETTALALSWTFYLLAKHPEIMDKLQAELHSVLGNRPPTYADLPQLPYTLQVFKEALRLYPPSSAILRVALRETNLGQENYKIRKGTSVIFSQYALHHRAANFPDPERFDPGRFTAENEQKLPRYAYLPFGAGHRVCIGNHFATMEGHLLLASIARQVRFEMAVPDEVVEPELMLTLRPKTPIRLRVVRNNAS